MLKALSLWHVGLLMRFYVFRRYYLHNCQRLFISLTLCTTKIQHTATDAGLSLPNESLDQGKQRFPEAPDCKAKEQDYKNPVRIQFGLLHLSEFGRHLAHYGCRIVMGDIGGIVYKPVLIGVLIHELIQIHRIIFLMLVYINAVMHIQGIPLDAVAVLNLGAHTFNDARRAGHCKACTN